MSDAAGWLPVHHEDAPEPDANDPVQEPQPAASPRVVKPQEPTPVPLTLVMSIPPELIAAMSSLSGTMERIATEVAAQGKAIRALAEAIAQQRGA